jgi:hypothetical protein
VGKLSRNGRICAREPQGLRKRSLQFLVTVLVGAMALTVGVGQGKPSIQFDSITRDAGTVQQGDVIKRVFIFTNRGGGILEILNVEHA